MNNLDNISNVYVNKDVTTTVDHRIKHLFLGHIKKYMSGDSILQMGYGGGDETRFLLTYFDQIHLVEGSESLCEKARSLNNERLVVHHSFFESFSVHKKFDLILCNNVLEHVDEPVAVLRKIKTFLSNNGKIFILVPNAQSIHRLFGVCLGLLKTPDELNQSDLKLGHRRVYDHELLHRHITEAGLNVIRELPTLAKFLTNEQMKDFATDEVLALFKLGEMIPLNLGGQLFFICAAQTD